jgi:hypothetical protein
MGLVGEPAARVHVDPLDLVALGYVDDVPGTPRTLFRLECHDSPSVFDDA